MRTTRRCPVWWWLRRKLESGRCTSSEGFHSPYFLDGVTYSYTPEDYTPMKTLYISIFNGKDWDISDKPVTE